MGSVRFILGRSGSGKTRRFFDRIVEACRADPFGPMILWLVPKQATFLMQRQLACASGLGGFARGQILSFDRLTDEILQSCGGAARGRVGELGRQMIIGHLLRRHGEKLQFFRSSARQVGLAGALRAMISELERAGLGVEELEAMSAALQQGSHGDDFAASSLSAKLHDVALVYRAYEAYLGQDRLDPRRRDEFVLKCASQWSMLDDAEVFIDDFWEFDAFEHRMIATLATRAKHTEISLTLDPASPIVADPELAIADLSLFHRTERTYRRLRRTLREAGIRVEPPVLLPSSHRFAAAAIGQLEQNFVTASKRPLPITPEKREIELIEAPDRRGEVEAAARRLRELAAAGVRWRDMAVLARDAADYHELIEPAFAEHGIPFFVDRRRAASHHPLLQFVRAALRLASGNWPHEPMMALLKSGLAGVSADDAGEIENFVLEHRLYGSAWADRKPWSFARRRRDDGDGHTPDPQSARMDALRRRLVARLGMFLGAVRCSTICVRQIVAHLYQLLESFQVRQTLSAWMRDATAHNRHEEAAEHEQAWRELGELFDQLVDLMGSEILPIDEFLEIVEVGLEEFDLALTPPTLDQVLVGQVDRSRLPETKAVILLGLNEGEFPRSPRGDAILGDRDRTLLRSQRQDLFEDLSRELLDERFLGYVAMTRASQTLILTRSLADPRGRKREASSLWRDVEEMLPDCTPVRIPLEAQRKPEHIATPRQLVTSLLRWARRPDAQALADATHSALYQWLATRPENEDDPTVRLARQAWASLCYTNEATLSPHIAKRLYDSSLNVTARQLESFAACPFKHFAEYTLKLQARPQDDVTGADISNACHRILGDIVRMLVQQRPDWPKLREALSQEAFDNVVATVGQELRGELLLSSARNRYLLGRIRRTIDQVLAAQEAMSSRCDFRPAAAGVRFGEGQKVPALPLKSPKGREASLSGQIDRVDVLEDQTAFAIFDYRLHGSTLALDWIFHGLSLELLLHAAVLRRGGLVPPTAQPAGAFFLTLLRRLQDIKHPEDLPDPSSPEFLLRYKPRGLFDERYLNRFDCDLDEGYSPVVSAYVKKDGTLGNRGRSDVLEAGQLESLLDLVERRASELIDQIADGRVEIEPYRLKDTSPCATCAFRCVCRFEVTINRYRHLPPVEREAMFGSSAKGDE